MRRIHLAVLISAIYGLSQSTGAQARVQAWETCTNSWGDVVQLRPDGSCPSDNVPLWYVYLNSPFNLTKTVTDSNERIAQINANARNSAPGTVIGVSNGSQSTSGSHSGAINSNTLSNSNANDINNTVRNNNSNSNSVNNSNTNNNTNGNTNVNQSSAQQGQIQGNYGFQ